MRTRPAAGACACRPARTSSRSSRARTRSSSTVPCRSWSRRAARAASCRRSSGSCRTRRSPRSAARTSPTSAACGRRAQARRHPQGGAQQVYKHTPLQTTFGVNMVALVDDVPRTLGLREPSARTSSTSARSSSAGRSSSWARPRLAPTSSRGVLSRFDNLDAVIETIRASRDAEAAREALQAASSALRGPGARASRCAWRRPRRWSRTRSSRSTPTSSSASASCATSSVTSPGLRRSSRRSCGRSPARRRRAHADHVRRGRDRHRGRIADQQMVTRSPRAATSSRCRSPPTARSAAAGAGSPEWT